MSNPLFFEVKKGVLLIALDKLSMMIKMDQEPFSLQLVGSFGDLPTYQYAIKCGDKQVGLIQLRQKPSSGPGIPDNMASHVYYEIDPDARGQGYATAALKLLLAEARRINLPEIWLTTYEDNLASKRVIEKNGGVLVDQVKIADRNFLKYSIKI